MTNRTAKYLIAGVNGFAFGALALPRLVSSPALLLMACILFALAQTLILQILLPSEES